MRQAIADVPAKTFKSATQFDVTLLTDSEIFAGTERHIIDLAGALLNEGVAVRIACPTGSKLHQHAGQIGVECLTAPRKFFVPAMTMTLLRQSLSSKKQQVIHAHNGISELIAALPSSLTGRGAFVATQHFVEPTRQSRRGLSSILSNAIHQWLSSRVGCAIAISEAVADAVRNRGDCPENKLVVVPNGIACPEPPKLTKAEARRALSIPAETTLILSLARLDKEKGLDTLIEAMAILAQRCPTAQCVIAGEGKERSALESLIAARGLHNSVKLLGYRTDTQNLLNACDAFVLPSICEPFGLVILEAMFAGRPVIAADAGGPREIIEHERSGLLFEPKNSSSLAQKLIMLLDPELSTRLAENGRTRANALYRSDRMARDIARVYERVFQT